MGHRVGGQLFSPSLVNKMETKNLCIYIFSGGRKKSRSISHVINIVARVTLTRSRALTVPPTTHWESVYSKSSWYFIIFDNSVWPATDVGLRDDDSSWTPFGVSQTAIVEEVLLTYVFNTFTHRSKCVVPFTKLIIIPSKGDGLTLILNSSQKPQETNGASFIGICARSGHWRSLMSGIIKETHKLGNHPDPPNN